MIKRAIILFVVFLTLTVRADEGMWLPSLLGDGRIKDMRAKGLRLTAEDLYSINKASLKDAIVRFGGGCTGELISDEGLLLTNHHCGYGQIQSHSTIEADYLTNGFAAMNRGEELPNAALTVTFLKEMRDVTAEVLAGTTDSIDEKQRQEVIARNITAIISRAVAGTHLKAAVEALYYGNQYFLFMYEVFEDVRLVFAPPSSIGKFGGDTDNWMWPRHTGDFSLFRIYADKNNQPAKYATDNVPYKPKRSFKISTGGVREGDFTFVYGFPGRTMQYLHSDAVRYLQMKGNPLKIGLRTLRLDVMNRHQEQDPVVRIKYAAKNASVANAWKKWQGELLGVERLKTVENKQKLEQDFVHWAQDKPDYRGVVEQLGVLYDSLEPYAYARDYYLESALAIELLKFAWSFADFENTKPEKRNADIAEFFKNYDRSIDREIAGAVLNKLRMDLDTSFLPAVFVSSEPDSLLARVFDNTIFLNEERLRAVLATSDARKIIDADPAMKLVREFQTQMEHQITPRYKALNRDVDLLYRHYVKGLMQMQPEGREFYPDANSTLRVAYGKVAGYEPRDGVYFKYVSTLEGVMQKDNPQIYDYDVPEKLRTIYQNKDYGQWNTAGTVPVCFIATNHTTGGNSGSPVLNARGELIGLNFDRVWEGTMSDIEYDPVVCRNIALDVRYVLFVIDKLSGAGYLINEMNLVK